MPGKDSSKPTKTTPAPALQESSEPTYAAYQHTDEAVIRYRLQFLGVCFAAITGILLREFAINYSESTIALPNLNPWHWEAGLLLQFVALLLLLEIYVVLGQYHVALEIRYYPICLFVDVMIALVFILFVILTKEQATFAYAMYMITGVFVVLIFRQIIPLLRLYRLQPYGTNRSARVT